MNAPNEPGAPSDSDSVAGTAPPALPGVCVYGFTPRNFRPSNTRVLRVSREATFSRPKPHSSVSSVDTPTLPLVVPISAVCVAFAAAKCGKRSATAPTRSA